MLRQILQALRFAIADFFDISWLGVAALLVVIVLLGIIAFIRTNYSWNSHQLLTLLLFAGVFIALAVAGKTLNHR